MKLRRKRATSLLLSMGKKGAMLVSVAGIGAGGVYGWQAAQRLWTQHPWLQVREVVFQGDIPSALPVALGVREGDQMFSHRLRAKTHAALDAFPELEALSLRRTFDRRIAVEGRYRRPVAVLSASRATGIDAAGRTFNISEMPLPGDLPVVVAGALPLPALAPFLDGLRRDAPEFTALVKMVKTDRILGVTFELPDGVSVEWGEPSVGDAAEKAEKTLSVLRHFAPVGTSAGMRFVTAERLVLDGRWKAINSKGG